MRRLYRASIPLILSLTGCATDDPAYDLAYLPPPPEVSGQQVAILSTWKPGMALSAMSADIPWQVDETKQEEEADGDWQFYYAENPASYAMFGMLYRDGALVALVSGEDGDHLLDCLNPYNLGGQSWVSHGLSAYGPWLQSRSIFGQPQALAATGTHYGYVHDTPEDRNYREQHPPAGEIAATVLLAPLAVVALPGMVAEGEIGGGRAAVSREAAFYGSMQLGRPAPHISERARDEFDIGGMHVRIEYAGFAEGIRAGRVVMLEKPSEYLWGKPPHRPVSGITRDDCEALRSPGSGAMAGG